MPDQDTGIGKLSDEVMADAGRKADRRRRSAKRDAEKIVEEARARAEKEAARVRQDAERRAERRSRLILAGVGQEIRRRRLLRQAAAIEERIQAAFDRAAGLAADDRRDALITLAVAGIEQMDHDAFRLRVSAGDRDVLDDAFIAAVRDRLASDGREPPEIEVDEESAAIAGGVIAVASDGAQMVDNSLEARRRRLAPHLRQMLAGMLFPGQSEGDTEPDQVADPADGEA